MVIDDADEQTSVIEEKHNKNSTASSLTTINSLVEKEISKTLFHADKRVTPNNTPFADKCHRKLSLTPTNSTQPPPLVTLTKAHSPSIHSHNQQLFLNKGSIMRGTPISPSNKPISIDTSTAHPHMHSQNFSSPRSDYSHHSSPFMDSPHVKSSKIIDQPHLYLPQQQQQSAYMRHYPYQQTTHNNNFSSSSNPTQYLQAHKSSSINSQQPQQTSTNANKPIGIDTSNTDTYETLRADFVTSRYLTTGHSPSHER